ncbi:MAG TPA: hypothetical protein VFH43_08815 [Candidatus Kapabacteria bacterium]|nr:hypothetical protein [Candidatus Kapabacteria bacterium]
MRITLERTADREWVVNSDAQSSPLGSVSRKQTGYLVTRSADGEVIKRFRLIDALRQAFGDEHTYETPSDTKPSEEGYV